MQRYLILILLFFNYSVFAGGPVANSHPCYFALSLGYGSTTWAQLVPTLENQNFAMRLAAPIGVTEGGFIWNGALGFELSNLFALEANYTHYPSVNIVFDTDSMFSFVNDGVTNLYTHTETMNFMAKFMVYIANTQIRAFSALGVAGLHRRDIIIDHWRLAPTFSAGFNYKSDKSFMIEFLGNFTAGYGESQLNPTDVYFPFLYAAMVRFAYFF